MSMMDTGKARSSRQGWIPIVLSSLIVLGLALSGVPVSTPLAAERAAARIVAPEGGTDLLAAPDRARKAAKRGQDRDQDRKQERKREDQKQDRKQKDHKPERKQADQKKN